ncbi:MAG: HEAT repeat domain-containing protein [Candidatus Poribacteria bacterium]|nr:HEAT repeat domain-containing protein [Candidatus Poribacteria bacterium]
MKKLLTICLVLTWVVSFGCKQEKIIPELKPGRQKLLAGLAIEAVSHLKLAEIEEKNKDEPRALLLIAYSYALSAEATWLKNNNLETEYRNERARRLAELNTSETEEIFQILNERHLFQKDVKQILIDKGVPVVPLILKSFIQSKYSDAHKDFDYILTQIGSKGIDELFTAVDNADTSIPVRDRLIRIIADIGDPSAQERLESLKNTVLDTGLKIEILSALYRLGNKAYQKDIEAALTDNNVLARQAAARSMILLNQPSTDKMIKALKDADDTVRLAIVQALEKHTDKNAVDNLFSMLTNDSSINTKRTVVETLSHYAEIGLADGLASRLIKLLIDIEISISNHEDRVFIVQLLKKPALIKQIQTADPYDNLPHKLDDYYRNKETNPTVNGVLNELLLELEKDETEE